ncbi:MAG: twin-arginine translocation signal domain-containing protein [Planctomycetota bacterium]|nr:twin-arginine translocation signal domain-containing protein [Planctomycetota bacterium]
MAIARRRDFLKAFGAGAAALVLPRWIAAAESLASNARAGRKPTRIGYVDLNALTEKVQQDVEMASEWKLQKT